MSALQSRSIDLCYFAWVREKVGRSRETLSPPETVATVADLITWLEGRGPEYQAAFAKRDVIRTAIDQKYVAADASIANAHEVAFFPPVTGG